MMTTVMMMKRQRRGERRMVKEMMKMTWTESQLRLKQTATTNTERLRS